MQTPMRAPAELKLDAFVRQYRSMAPLRLGLPLMLSVMVATVTPLPFAAGFGLLHMALYLVFFWAVEVAARGRGGAPRALRRLTVRTGLITFMITLHACWMALAVRDMSTEAYIRTEAALVVIGVLMFTGTQTHMSRIGYLAGIAPALVSLMWISVGRTNQTPNLHLMAVVGLFLVSVIAVTWRQQETSLALRITRLELEDKNTALTDMVTRAEAAQATAEAANRAKSDFLAMTSHEIRTPLNAVLGLAEALNRSRLSAGQKDMARGVVDAGALLKRLLDAMLDIGRIEAGKMTLSAGPFDLRRAAETVVRIWTPRAEEQGVTLALDLSGVPAGCGLIADGGKVEQVLINLISNALKFSPRGGVVTVRVAARPETGGAGLTVRAEVLDQGPGVTPADRARIFSVFEQTAEGRRRGGAGLGLAICAGNLALMDGTIEVGEAPGGGAAFRIAFTAPACRLTETAPLDIEAGGLDEANPLRVLAAEDNAGNRHVLEALLGPLPVTLTLVENAPWRSRRWRPAASTWC